MLYLVKEIKSKQEVGGRSHSRNCAAIARVASPASPDVIVAA